MELEPTKREFTKSTINTNTLQQICRCSNLKTNLSTKRFQQQNESVRRLSSISDLISEDYFDFINSKSNLNAIGKFSPAYFECKKLTFKKNFQNDLNQEEDINNKPIKELNKNNFKKNFSIYKDLLKLIKSDEFNKQMSENPEICKYVMTNKYLDLIDEDKVIRIKYIQHLRDILNQKMEDNRTFKLEPEAFEVLLSEEVSEDMEEDDFEDDGDYSSVI